MYSIQEFEREVRLKVMSKFKNMDYLYFKAKDNITYEVICSYYIKGKGCFLQSIFERIICLDEIENDKEFYDLVEFFSDEVISEIRFRRECMS